MRGQAGFRSLAGVVGLTAGLWVSLAGSAAGEELAALVRQPLPLAIRDGRIAHLTAHAVPFDIGHKELAPATAAALDGLVAGLATDCFLTAQAIGHVRPGTPGDGDTLAAHRLARARAEAVEAALTGGGLPAESVASVWDFQFTVREPRVTLWVFSLPQGDECEGKPLPGAKARIAVAELPQPEPSPPASAAEEVAAPGPVEEMASPGSPQIAARDPEPAPGIHLPGPPPMAEPAVAAVSEPTMPAALVSDEPATTEPVPASPPAAVATPGLPARVSAPEHAAPPLTSAVAAGRTAAPTPVAAAPETVSPVETAVIVEGPATPPATAAEPVATAELVFEPNSSFFPRGAEAELKRLVAALPAGRGYEFEVQAAVDDRAARADSPEKAVAYNKWLADRRQGRVAEWLEQHAEIRVLEVRRSLLEHDPSRRVVIRARPLP
jgi:hypothetical protein